MTMTQGTGKYDGATWDGKRWTMDGQPVKIGPWANTHTGWKIIIITVLAGVCLTLGMTGILVGQ